MLSPRALVIALCGVVVASCNGGSGNPDAGTGGSAGGTSGTTGVSGSGGGAGARGGAGGGGSSGAGGVGGSAAGGRGGNGGGGAGGASAGAGGTAGAAGQGGGAGGRGGGAAGQGGGAGAGGQGGGAGGRGGGAAGQGGGAGAGGQGGGTCAFASTYTIIDGGGLAPSVDTATLTPPNAFRYERQVLFPDAGTTSCAPAMPACGDATRIDVSEVEAAIAHPDVQTALAMTARPIYGDRGIADGPSFNFTRADGRGFSAGIPCNVPSATCTLTPAGVTALAQVVRMLIDQQLTDASCAQLR